jgi:hypothetical protein
VSGAGGATTVDWKDEARSLRAQGRSEREIAEAVGKSPSSVHEAVKDVGVAVDEANGSWSGDTYSFEVLSGAPTPGQQTIDGGEVQSVYVEQIRVDGTTQVAIDFGGKQAQTARLTLSGAVEVDGFFRKGDRIRGTFEAVVVGIAGRDKIDKVTGIPGEAVQTHTARVVDLVVD